MAHKSQWKFCTGLSDFNESIIDATYREVYEEIGLKKDEVEVLGNVYYRLIGPYDKDRVMDLCFFNLAVMKKDIKVEALKAQLCPDELSDVCYFPMKELRALINADSDSFTYHTRAVLKNVFAVLDDKKSYDENIKEISKHTMKSCDEEYSKIHDIWRCGFTSLNKNGNNEIKGEILKPS
eukprot:CAMPEP_0170534428 /NCGR_PEP_ID=MMETSP0209-20121228/91278_1 /TAXON_ID=665100 ORGANISM="Litonotus pictus, Strain P1" /NCGR_SAMPLE_ID=MMETSP0209 /ASSEMBLY_ACC=CAM_ASM_000301 /LENGTH=179 /DNA_ID=CAMNT_0010833815 /DNA_START=427 /DNA_END=962 /DNA_ORIENTATION=+